MFVVDVLRALDEPGFFAAVVAWLPVAAGFLEDELASGFFALWLAEVAASEKQAACGSDRFPSTGATTSKAQRIAVSTRAGRCAGRGEETEFIESL